MTPAQQMLTKLKGVSPSEILIDRRLASGGVSDLWLASHPSVSCPFLVKYSMSECTDNPYILGQFEREYEASSALMQRNLCDEIVYIVDFDTDVLKHPYIYMELFHGQSLEQMRKKIHDWKSARLILNRTVQVLTDIHEAGIIHRDIKPGNILIDSQYHVRLIDFALSTIDGQWHRYHEEGMALGTPLYMSPEQAFGKKHMLSAAADWYSFGVSLFEWMSGTVPFHGPSSLETMKMHCYDEPPVPKNCNIPDAPPELPEMCHSLLCKNVAQRWKNIHAFKAFLAQ